mmetsp:Transcript_21292/g.24205  ORF Transcript_21292/g.24205 Transcript_21292/m.24205 type:complete len:663 (-) Transcript_21292:154-2142(-)
MLLLNPNINIYSILLLFTFSTATTVAAILSDAWHELGRGIGYENFHDFAGQSVASSSDGLYVAIGAPLFSESMSPTSTTTIEKREGLHHGRVRIYNYNPNRNAWSKIGNDIIGESNGEQAGYTLAMTMGGHYLAVGSPYYSTADKKEVGCVRVYELQDEIRPKSAPGQGGHSNGYDNSTVTFDLHDIDKDGKYNEFMTYNQVGNDIIGQNKFDHFGIGLSLRDILDGENALEKLVLFVGAPDAKFYDDDPTSDPVGKVYAYEFDYDADGLLWTSVTPDVTHSSDNEAVIAKGTQPYGKFGATVSADLPATMVAIGAPLYNHVNNHNFAEDQAGQRQSGCVFVYGRNHNGVDGWSDLNINWDENVYDAADMTQAGEQCGTSVSLALRGNFVAFGCPYASHSDGDDEDVKVRAGVVKTFQLTLNGNSDSGVMIYQAEPVPDNGRFIRGENEGDLSGMSIDLQSNLNGNIFLGIGSPNNSPNAEKKKAGHIRVYHFDEVDNVWEQAGLDVDGENAFDHYGSSMKVSFDGHRVAASASEGGYAKIYELAYTANPTPSPTKTSPSSGSPGDNIAYGDDNRPARKPGTSAVLIITIVVLVLGTIYGAYEGYRIYRVKRHLAASEVGDGNDMTGSMTRNNEFGSVAAGNGFNTQYRDAPNNDSGPQHVI